MITRKTLLLNSTRLILLIFILNFLAIFFFSWYWTIWWFDLAMHFFGGLFVGLMVLWLFHSKFSIFFKNGMLGKIFIFVFLSVLAVALSWEIFEFGMFKIFPAIDINATLDTVSDILLGLAGGLTGVIYFARKINCSSKFQITNSK